MNLRFLLAFLVGLSLACIYSAAPSAFARVAFGRGKTKPTPVAAKAPEKKEGEQLKGLPTRATAKMAEPASLPSKSKRKI